MGQARESGAARWAAGGRPRLMTVGDDGGSELPENAPSGVMKGAQLGRLWNSARLERRMHPICWLQRHDRLTTASLPHRPCAASILLKILLIKASRVGSPCWLNPPGVRGCRLAAAASSRPRLRGGRRRGPPVRVQFREGRRLVLLFSSLPLSPSLRLSRGSPVGAVLRGPQLRRRASARSRPKSGSKPAKI